MTSIHQVCESCHDRATRNGNSLCDKCWYRQEQERERAYGEHAEAVVEEPSSGPPVFDDTCLYGPLGDLVQAVLPETEAHPAAIYAVLLARFGVSAGFGKFLGLDPKHPARIFPLLCGPSGWGRKGTASQVASKIWTLVDPGLRVVQGISSGQGLIEIIRDRNPNDPKDLGGTTDKRMHVIEEELTKLRAVKDARGATTGDTLKQLFDLRERFDNPRVCAARVTRPHVTCEVHATPTAWARLPEDDIRTGFLNRFYHVWCEATKELPRGGDWLNEDVRRLSRDARLALEEVRKWGEDCCLDLTAKADIAWCERYHETHIAARNRGDHVLNELLARGPDQIARVALTTALTQKSKTVPEEALIAACKFWDYSMATIEYLFPQRVSSTVEQGVAWAETRASADHAGTLLKELFTAREAGMTLTDIYKVLGKRVSAPDVRKLLAVLEHHGQVVVRDFKPPTGRTGKRTWAKGFEPVFEPT